MPKSKKYSNKKLLKRRRYNKTKRGGINEKIKATPSNADPFPRYPFENKYIAKIDKPNIVLPTYTPETPFPDKPDPFKAVQEQKQLAKQEDESWSKELSGESMPPFFQEEEECKKTNSCIISGGRKHKRKGRKTRKH